MRFGGANPFPEMKHQSYVHLYRQKVISRECFLMLEIHGVQACKNLQI